MSPNNSKPQVDSLQTEIDPFDPAALRLSQDFSKTVGVKKVLTQVPCRKPRRQEFVRVRPGLEWRVDTAVFEDEIEKDVYIVAKDLIPELVEQVKPVCLRVAMNKQGELFLWPLKLPGADGRTMLWHESAIDAATLAEKKWVRMSANMGAGMYDVFEAAGDLVEPEWPELSFRDILKLAFQDRRIDAPDHPILRRLRGEV